MRHPVARLCGAILALLLVIGPTAAGEIHWSYEWGVLPTVIHADPVFYPLVVTPGGPLIPPHAGEGSITLHTKPYLQDAVGSTDVIAARIRTHSLAPAKYPAHFTDAPYELTLYIHDDCNGKSGFLTFDGVLWGKLTATSAKIHNGFTSPETQTLHLGDDVFEVTIGPYLPPGPPGPGNAGAIGASVEVRSECCHHHCPDPSPEPSTLVLAGLASPALGLWYWRRRRPGRSVGH